ncbi:hypothetical protein NC652_005007 [Populus alba x Populus x berolinensis]|nr:hypothetical protein NC652_005007 [Populus alba x Populus x berolinensis]
MSIPTRRITYPKISLIQRWKKEKYAGVCDCSGKDFSRNLQKASFHRRKQIWTIPLVTIDDPSGQNVDNSSVHNITKSWLDPTVVAGDMAGKAPSRNPERVPLGRPRPSTGTKPPADPGSYEGIQRLASNSSPLMRSARSLPVWLHDTTALLIVSRSGSAIYDVSSRQSLFSTIIEEQPSLTVTVALLHLL